MGLWKANLGFLWPGRMACARRRRQAFLSTRTFGSLNCDFPRRLIRSRRRWSWSYRAIDHARNFDLTSSHIWTRVPSPHSTSRSTVHLSPSSCAYLSGLYSRLMEIEHMEWMSTVVCPTCISPSVWHRRRLTIVPLERNSARMSAKGRNAAGLSPTLPRFLHTLSNLRPRMWLTRGRLLTWHRPTARIRVGRFCVVLRRWERLPTASVDQARKT